MVHQNKVINKYQLIIHIYLYHNTQTHCIIKHVGTGCCGPGVGYICDCRSLGMRFSTGLCLAIIHVAMTGWSGGALVGQVEPKE